MIAVCKMQLGQQAPRIDARNVEFRHAINEILAAGAVSKRQAAMGKLQCESANVRSPHDERFEQLGGLRHPPGVEKHLREIERAGVDGPLHDI